MAIVTPISSTVRLGFQTGVDEKGNPIIKVRNLNRVKTTALEQDILEVAQKFASLQEYPLVSVRKVNTVDISA